MPIITSIAAAIVAVSASIGITVTTAVATTLATTLVTTVVSVGFQLLNTFLFAPKVGGEFPDVISPKKSEDSPARYIVGAARTGGVLTWYKEVDPDTYPEGPGMGYLKKSARDCYTIYALSEGACEGIMDVYSDGEKIELERTGNVLRGKGKWRTYINIAEGFNADGEDWESIARVVNPSIAGTTPFNQYAVNHGYGVNFSGQPTTQNNTNRHGWTKDHQLKGISYVVIHLRNYVGRKSHDPSKRFWQRFPDLQFAMKGMKLTWPGQNVPTWTENAAAIRFWFRSQRRGIPDAAFDIDSVRAAFTLCDESVTVALPEGFEGYEATSKRYTINGIFTSEEQVIALEDAFDFAWQGAVVDDGGVSFFRPGAERMIYGTIEEDDVIRTGPMRIAPPLQRRVNTVTATLPQSKAHDYSKLSMTIIDEQAKDRDGGRPFNETIRGVAFVNNPVALGRLTTIFLKKVRSSLRQSLVIRPGEDMFWAILRPTDRVKVILPRLGHDERIMVVDSMTLNTDFSISVELVEYLAGTYEDSLVLPPIELRTFGFGLVEDQTPFELRPPIGITIDEVVSFRPDQTMDIFLHVRWILGAAAAYTQVRWRFKSEEAAQPTQDIALPAGVVVKDTCHIDGNLLLLNGNANIQSMNLETNEFAAPINLSAGTYNGLATDWVSLFTIRRTASALVTNPWRRVRSVPWVGGVSISDNALRAHQGIEYISTQGHVTSSANAPGVAGAPWEAIPNWAAGTQVSIGDYNVYQSAIYKAETNHNTSNANRPDQNAGHSLVRITHATGAVVSTGELPGNIRNPQGMWLWTGIPSSVEELQQGIDLSEGVLFIADEDANHVFAIAVAGTERFYSMEFDTDSPVGIWGDLENLWVSKRNSNNLFAVDMVYLIRDTSYDYEANFAVAGTRCIWSDNRSWYIISRDGLILRKYLNDKELFEDDTWIYVPAEDDTNQLRFTHPLFAKDIAVQYQLRAGRAEEESPWTDTGEYTIGGDLGAPGAPDLTFSSSFGGYVLTWVDPRATIDDYDRTQVQELIPNGDPAVDIDWTDKTFTDGTSYVRSGGMAGATAFMVRARHIDSSKNEGPWATAQGSSLTIAEAMGSGINGLPGVGKILFYGKAETMPADVDAAGEYAFLAGVNAVTSWETLTAEMQNTITHLLFHNEDADGIDREEYLLQLEYGDAVTWFDSVGRRVSFLVAGDAEAGPDA